jgi:hypothetical protein
MGKKRPRSDDTEAFTLVMERMEEHAAEREERIRKLELEMEERRTERENKREDRILGMFSAMFGNRPSYPGAYHQPQLFAYHGYQQPRMVHSTVHMVKIFTPRITRNLIMSIPQFKNTILTIGREGKNGC